MDKNIRGAGPNHLDEPGFGPIHPSLSGKTGGLGTGRVGRPATVRPCRGRGGHGGAVGLDPSNCDHAEEMILLYRVAGPPVKAVRPSGIPLAPGRRQEMGHGWPESIWTDGVATCLLPRPGRPR